MKCNLDYYKYFIKPKARTTTFTDKQLQEMKTLDSKQLSKYIGMREYLDKADNELLAKTATIKNQVFASQSQKGQSTEAINAWAKSHAEKIADNMFPEEQNAIYKAGEALLLNRSKGQVFSMAEKELITPVFINAMNNMPLLSKQITNALDEGNDAAALVLTTELNKTMAKVAAFYGDVNATSRALNHYKKINGDIKLGKQISGIFASGGC